jgi:HAD-superfamily hydrolase, subfamily IIIA
VEEYRIKCNCRKPAIGMFQNACRRLDIDITNSYMVGDRAGDIIAGQNAGLKTILLESGYGTARLEEDVMPDYVVDDLRSVLELL